MKKILSAVLCSIFFISNSNLTFCETTRVKSEIEIRSEIRKEASVKKVSETNMKIANTIFAALGKLCFYFIGLVCAVTASVFVVKRAIRMQELIRQMPELNRPYTQYDALKRVHKELRCPICWETFVVGSARNSLVKTYCCQVGDGEPPTYYHKKCLDGWLKNNKICPICKKKVDNYIDFNEIQYIMRLASFF